MAGDTLQKKVPLEHHRPVRASTPAWGIQALLVSGHLPYHPVRGKSDDEPIQAWVEGLLCPGEGYAVVSGFAIGNLWHSGLLSRSVDRTDGRCGPSACGRSKVIYRIGFIVFMTVASSALGQSQQCNPAIDGTYCASVPIHNPASRGPSPSGLSNAALGSALSSGSYDSLGSYDRPATLGAVTFSGGSRCIGLLRKMNCEQ